MQRYAVVGYPSLGTFAESETHRCIQCSGGKKNGRPCDWCAGTGRLLGSSALYWPRPVTLVEAVEDRPEREEVPSEADANTPRVARSGQQLELVEL